MTQLSILVETSYKKQDGYVFDFDGNYFWVRMLPVKALEGLSDDAKWKRLRHEFSQFRTVTEDQRRELMGLVLLVQAVQTHSLKAVQTYARLMARLKPQFGIWKRWDEYTEMIIRKQPAPKYRPDKHISQELNRKVRAARFVLWRTQAEGKFVPGLYCDDIRVALAALIFTRIVSPQALAVCERCGNPFERTKRVQRFCSLRCGNADRQARLREGR